MSRTGHILDDEFQWMAAKGYVVLYPNPRGSTTYGQEWKHHSVSLPRGRLQRPDAPAWSSAIKRGYIEEKKLGVTGGSGGGLLTNWVVGQTNRFAAAVAQRDIASWEDWWYSGDFTLLPAYMVQGATVGRPAGVSSAFTNQFHQECNDADDVYPWRSRLPDGPPGSGGEQMFRALKFRKIPAVMVRFPNESHKLSAPLRSAVASCRTPAASRCLVRSLANGYAQARIRGRTARRRVR